MADPRFFNSSGSFTLGELAEITGSDPLGGSDPGHRYTDVAALDQAGPDEVSFLDNKLYLDAFGESRAGLCLVRPEHGDQAPSSMILLLSDDPYRAYAKVARAFYPLPRPTPGIHPSAFVDDSASLGQGCQIEAGAVIGAKAELGNNCVIGPNAVIGPGVVLGDETRIGPGASISCALVGAYTIIHDGARVGQDGFGFAMGSEGHLKVPQLGRVIIGDDVEIGANTTIDRGAGPDTVIGDGCRIDNLVQIAHNVQMGRGCVIVAQVGISGSTRLDDFVIIGGQAGLTGHLHLGAGAKVAANSGVMRNVGPGEAVGGSPALPVREWHRQTVAISRLAKGKAKKSD